MAGCDATPILSRADGHRAEVSALVGRALEARSLGALEEERECLEQAALLPGSGVAALLAARKGMEAAGAAVRAGLPSLPKASVIIPVHDGIALTRDCLDSLAAHPSRCACEIVVVDDASRDGTGDYLQEQEEAGRIRLVRHLENAGFAASCNDGAAAATGDVLVFLNNDTLVSEGWLDALVEELARDPQVGIAGSRLLYPDGTLQHAGMVWEWHGNHPHPEHAFRHRDGELPEARVTLDYPCVTGACLAIPTGLFRELGGFTRELGMYCEDVDLCLKAWRRGLRVRYVPSSCVVHLESATPMDLQRRAEKSREAAERLRESWKGRWPEAFDAMPEWMWPRRARRTPQAETGVAWESPREARPVVGFDLRTLSDPQSHGRGIGQFALHHLEALARRPDAPRLVAVIPGEAPDPQWAGRFEGLPVEWMPASRYRPGSFDLVHTPDPMGLQEGYASPLGFFDEPRLSVLFHDLIPLRFYREGMGVNWPAYLVRLERLKASGATFLCNSEHTRSEVVSHLGVPPFRAVAVGAGLNRPAASEAACDPAALRARLGIRGDYCLYVGAMDPHKNFEGALQAVLSANATRQVQLLVTGRPNAAGQFWVDKLTRAGIGHLVVFTGFLERAELETLYAEAVALVFLSRLEGFGFPALEAMAGGCPVICSEAASLPEVVGSAALLHAPDDVDGATASILKLCTDPVLREELVRKGREQAALFTWDAVARRTLEAWRSLLREPARAVEPERPRSAQALGSKVSWVSPVFDPSGYASEARAFLLGLEAVGLAPAVKAAGRHSETFARHLPAADREILSFQIDRAWDLASPVVFDLPAAGFARLSDRPHVGRTTFETDGLPAGWIAKCNAMDEIWVPSQFNLETFRAAGVTVPLLRVPEGVETERFRPGLEPLPLPGERRGTTFLSVFEWTHRKGWDILLRAWADAFKAGDDVELVLRAYPANAVEGDPTAWVEERIGQFLSSIGTSRERCAPIVVLGTQIPEADMPRLYAAADVYLAPSRGEGWGRPHMEAMSCGLPVIATRWSGNLDFMDDANSWLVEVEAMEGIDACEEFEFYRGQRWARPGADHLAGLMRRAAASPDGRKLLGAKARQDMVEHWDWARVAGLAAVRLEEIRRGVPVSASKVPELAPAPRCAAVTDSVEARRHDVRWSGPLLNHSGHARQSREAILGLVQTGVRVSVDPLFTEAAFVESLADDEAAARRWDRILQAPPRKGVLVCCDLPSDASGRADVLFQAVGRNPGNRALAAWCTFETDRLPVGWAAKLERADEVWVPSTFNREGFVRAGVPAGRIHVVPEGIDPEPYRGATPRVLPESAGCTFLSVFQWSRRKGWDVLLEAWAKAFGPEDDVQLVLRCSPFAAGLESIEEQAKAFLGSKGLSWEAMAPVVLLADPIPEREMPGLYAACDVFVLPTRGEGWGLPYLEAMAAGKPCIATAWGGQCDFLHQGVAWMLPPGELVAPDAEALAENPFLGGDHRWADPRVDDLVEALRSAFLHRDEGKAKGAQAAREVREKWTPRHTAHAILERLAILDPHRPESEAILAPLHPAPRPAQTTLERPMTDDPLHVRWEGSQFVHHSLAHINREVCLELALRGHDMALQPWEQDEFRPAPGERLEPLSQLVQAPLEAPAQVHVRHQWPPQLQAPSEGRWVAIQPWEFGPVPKAWVSAWKEDLDELWVPSRFVKDGYVQSGMPSERVAVIPNGVDADRFCPSAKAFEIPSPRGFRFLFVGGTIYRKGIDILLTAYARAFRNTDDVSLVIKDMGGKTFYRGQTADDLFERFGSQPGNPELIVIDEPLSDAELPGLYTACHCLAHPYRGEGFGMPILEAMSAGLPVIVTGGGPAVEFCSPESAWFVPAVRKDLPSRSIGDMECAAQPWLLEPDVEALARLMREAYENRDLCRSKGAKGREIALSSYTWKHMADRVEERLRAVSALPQRRSDRVEPARNPLDPSQRNSAPSGEDEELNLLLVQIEPALMRGDAQEAKALVNEAVERFPEHPLSWLTRAMLQRGSGKPGLGLADAERSIQCRETPEALQEAIECCLSLNRQADAERLLKRLEREWSVWCGQAKVNPAREWIGGKVRRGAKAPKAPAKKKARG